MAVLIPEENIAFWLLRNIFEEGKMQQAIIREQWRHLQLKVLNCRRVFTSGQADGKAQGSEEGP